MFRVFSCLATEHNYWLIGLAALVCISTALCAFTIYSIAVQSRGPRQIGWACITGVCAGSGVWATHFVAMLAYDGGFPTAYEPVLTLGSLLVAIITAAGGFALAVSGNRWRSFAGGTVIGAAIGFMHFTGMKAMLVPGTILWNVPLVVSSWTLGIGLASGGLLAFHSTKGLRAILLGSALFTLAICGLHFVAMGAVTVLPDPTVPFEPSGLNRVIMAILVAGVTLIVLLSALAAAAIENANIRCEMILREQNSRLEAALRHLPIGMSMFDADQRLILCNQAYREIYGFSDKDTPAGKPFTELVSDSGACRAKDRTAKSVDLDPARHRLSEYCDRLARGDQFSDVQRLSDGRTIFVRIVPIVGGGWVDINEDITHRLQQEAEITHMARHDSLTGLPNRVHLREKLTKLLDGGCESDDDIVVHFLDLDRFKEVNDTLGHAVGDALLKQVADRLQGCVRETDMVARIGGDEFVVVQRSNDPLAEAAALASRLIDVISAPYSLPAGHQVHIGTSVGIAIAPQDAVAEDALLQHADIALYCSKDEGGGQYRFFKTQMIELVQARRELEADLRSALANGEFVLNYQPLVNLECNRVSGFEALLRWHHPRRGPVAPNDFIPLAEETALIGPIGEWVLRQACAEAATWPEHFNVAVNLSAVQFKQHNLCEIVMDAVTTAGLPPNRLELEITESVLLDVNETTLASLNRLRSHGIRIAIDDFGTGYSSLNYLRVFPFDKIKIDRCFVAHLSADDANNVAIVRAMIGLGRALGVDITAEGVETERELDQVRLEGCTEMQGFLFSEAKPASEIRQWFSASSSGQAGDGKAVAA